MNRVKDGSRDSGRDPQGLDAKHESAVAKPERPALVSKLTSLMPKVTEGPWSIYEDQRTVVRTNQAGCSFQCDPDPEWIDCNTEANAELIALAPELATAFLAQAAILEEAVSALEIAKLAFENILSWTDEEATQAEARQTLTRISEAQSHANQ